MDGDVHKAGLYRWQRQTKPVVQSRAHRVANSNDIQDWIKKVEEASDKATDVAFGLMEPSALSGKKKGRELAQTHSRQARFEEEAHSEAQELLRQWVTDKVHFDADDGYDDLEAWRRARQQQKEREAISATKGKNNKRNGEGDYEEESAADILNNIKLGDDDDDADIGWDVDEAAIYERVKRSALGDEDPYAHLYDMDENEAVSSVLKTLMSKNVVKEAFRKDLGFDKDKNTGPDPRTKMELRHQMVKENREKRQKEELKKMKERQIKKEAKVKAQQMIMKEQKDKEAQVRREEEEIKREMMRLRKELGEENRRKEDKIRREREEKEALERLAREELDRQNYEEGRMQLEMRRMESERRKQHLIKQELWRSKQESKNLKCLHLHFNAWYDHVLSRRLLLGKVKAMSDWKVMVRVWGAWKAYVRGQRAQVASVLHEKEVIETHRKTLISETHYRHGLLRKCLTSWRYFVKEEVERREMEEEKNRTKHKMISLLNAVAEGRIANERSGSSAGFNTDRSGRSDASSWSKNSKSSRLSRNTQQHQNMKDHHRGVHAWVDGDGGDDSAEENNIDNDNESQCFSEFTNVTRRTNNTTTTNMNAGKNGSRPNSALSWQRTKLEKSQLKSKSSSSLTRPASAMSSVSSGMASNATTKGRKPIPIEAWQVTKQHTRLPVEDIRNLGEGQGECLVDEDGEYIVQDLEGEGVPQNFTDAQIRKRFGTQPWMNRHYVVNNLEHRYKAQQKALRQQQEEIKEQKKLIQDLQYKQFVMGVTPSGQTTPVIEAPPKGNEIPRDIDDISNKDGRNTGSSGGSANGGAGNIVIHSGNTSTTLTNTKPAAPFEIVEEDGQITNRSGLTSVSETSKVSSTTSQNTKYLQVLKNMEERSAQRARQKAEREEKRRRQEEEKLAQLEKQEAERLREMEEEKKARVEAYRQKKRLEKQKEEERLKEAGRQQELTERAKAHYQRSIMKYRGLLPLKKLISMSKRNWNVAVKHHNRSLVKHGLKDWREFTQAEIQRKIKMADEMGQFLLVKHCFERWRKHKYHTEFLLRRADRHYEASLRAKTFYVWVEWKEVEKVEMAKRMQMAVQYYWDHLLRSRFLAWKFLPEKQKREEERKKRKMEMRARVAELIPDYAPRESLDKRVADRSDDFG